VGKSKVLPRIMVSKGNPEIGTHPLFLRSSSRIQI
jgi:hypothetical protein